MGIHSAETLEQAPTRNVTIPWRQIVLVFLLSRGLIVLGVLLSRDAHVLQLVGRLYEWGTMVHDPALTAALSRTAASGPSDLSSLLMQIARYWDGAAYLRIIQEGIAYNGNPMVFQTAFLYPLFPLVVAVFSKSAVLVGLSPLDTALGLGLVLNHLLFFLSLGMLYTLVRRHSTETCAMGTVILLALYPGSLFFSGFLSESLCLFLGLAAFLALENRRFWLASMLAVPFGLVRVNSLAFLPAFALAKGREKFQPYNFPVQLSMVAAGTCLYPAYLWWQYGTPAAYFTFHLLHRGGYPHWEKIALFSVLFALGLGVSAGWRRLTYQWPAEKRRRYLYGLLTLGLFVGVFYRVLAWEWPVFSTAYEAALNTVLLRPGDWAHVPGLYAFSAGSLVLGLNVQTLPKVVQAYTFGMILLLLAVPGYVGCVRYAALLFPLFWCLAAGLSGYSGLRRVCHAILGGLLFLFAIAYAATPDYLIFF